MRSEHDYGTMELLEGRVLLNGDSFPDLGLLEDPNNPVIRMQTERGQIFIELLENEAPNTVRNFLDRLDNMATNQTFFHHLVPGVSLEGGSWFFLPNFDGNDDSYSTDVLNSNAIRIDDPAEAGRANLARTISARWDTDSQIPGAGTPSQLVFNLADNTVAHPSDVYVVFARVIDDPSWAVVQDIASLPVGNFGTAPNVYSGLHNLIPSVPLDMPYTDGDPASPDIVVQSSDMLLIKQSGASDYYHHTLYSAEGFTGATISEFIPIVNPNAEDVHYEVRVRYERAPGTQTAVRDDLVIRGVLAANSRGGATVSTPENWSEAEVIANRAYAIEVWSTLPISANFSHYDFGIATGEAFVGTLDANWFIGDVEKDNDGHDFILWYNPTDQTGTVTLTFRAEGVESLDPITFSTEALRRGGININSRAEIPNGRYSVTIESTVPIIASVSHYGVTGLGPPIDGWAAIGQAGAPSTVGIVPIAYSRGGEDAAFQDDLGFVFYNSGANDADVSIDFYIPGSATPVESVNVVTLSPGQRHQLRIQQGDLSFGPIFTAVIRSTQAIYSSEWYLRIEDSYSAGVAVNAANEFHFAEGFTDPARTASNVLEESMTIFNPFGTAFGVADQTATVTLTFRYTDGTMFTIQRSIDGGSNLNIDISSLPEVIEQADEHDRFFYSIAVTSDVPIIAQFMHTDRTLGMGVNAGGGFSSFGTAFGSLTRVEDLGND